MSLSKLSFFFSLLVILFVKISESEAQTDFIKGYYVTLTKDTVRGYIAYLSDGKNSQHCFFKTKLGSLTYEFTPHDIAGFTFGDSGIYEAQEVNNGDAEELGFYKVLARGKLSLLRYKGRYYAKTQDRKIFEISNKKGAVNENRRLSQDRSGLGTLISLMRDCETITSSFLETKYKSNSYVSIFETYNKCVGSNFVKFKRVKVKPHVDFALQAAVVSSKLKLGSPLESANLQTRLNINVGGSASIFIPRINENIRLVAEITYSKYSQYMYYSKFINFANTNNDLFIDYSCLKAPVFIRYRQTGVFFDLGVQNQFTLRQQLKWRIETFQLNNTIVTTEGKIIPLDTWSFGYLVGIGLNSHIADHPLRTSLRFSRTQGANHPNKPTTQLLELICSFQLTK